MQQGPYDSQPLTPRRSTGWIIALCVGAGCLVLAIPLITILAAIIFPVFAQARMAARRANCMSNTKQVASALLMYTQDYDEQLPPAAGWENNLQSYLKNLDVYKCPERPRVVPAYAYNQLLDRRPLKQVQNAAQTPAFFESSLGATDAADRLQSFATPHQKGRQPVGMVAFVDGSVRQFPVAPKASAGLAPLKPVGKRSGKGAGG